MPFERPSLSELYQRARADIIEAMPEVADFRFSLADIHAKAIAGSAHTLHAHIAHLAETLLPDSDDPEAIEHWARITATTRKDATTARGPVAFYGEDGRQIPAGTRLQGPEARVYQTIAPVKVSQGAATTEVVSEDPGARMNLGAGAALTLINPVAGVKPEALVSEPGIKDGTDRETDRELRRRYLYKLQNPPRGGHITDYIRWTEEVPGVARAFVFRHHQGIINQIGVTFTSTGEDPIPPIGGDVVRRVREYLESVRPEAAKVVVFVPIRRTLALKVKVAPDNEAVRKAVTLEVTDLLSREAGVGGAFQTNGTIYVSHISEAIAQADGEDHHVLIEPATDVVPALYEIVTLGGIEWVV